MAVDPRTANFAYCWRDLVAGILPALPAAGEGQEAAALNPQSTALTILLSQYEAVIRQFAGADPDAILSWISAVSEAELICLRLCLRAGDGSIVMFRVPLGSEDELDTIQVPSLASLFAGAIWHERETWDLWGLRFNGNPDLRRILMPPDWQGFPLRKSYAIDTPCEPYRPTPEFSEPVGNSESGKS